MKFATFKKFILPQIIRDAHGDELLFRQKAVASLNGEPLLGEDGQEIDVEEIMLVGNTAVVDEEPATTQEDIDETVRRALGRITAGKRGSRGKRGKSPFVISGGTYRNDDKSGHGFKSFGQFAQAVYQAGSDGGTPDSRLQTGLTAKTGPTLFGNESTGADGGFLIPPDFSDQVRMHSLEGDSLLPLTDNMPVTGNSMTFPADETTPWGTNGIRCFWKAEGAQATETKPSLKTRTLRLEKLFALVPVTDELVSDAATLETFLANATGRSIRWKTNDAIINGTGAGQPLGIFNSAALVSIAKESGQAADTLVADNVAKMFARMPGSSVATSVWLMNNDVYPQLITMVLSNHGIWTPPATGFADAPGGFLFGRPVMLSQTAQTLGDKGDIFFLDLKQYASISKDIDSQTSIHLWFDFDITAFRATFRVDGQPWLDSQIVPNNGTNNLSPFVTLDERA